MALSGAALTPAGGENLLFRVFLMITNFRMGQWVPTPALTPTDSVRAFPLRLLWNRIFFPSHQRSLCFLTDGGFAENIGVAPLLQRRCRLIIAIDGSCDPDSQFLDLAKLMRLAESRYGVKFTSLQSAERPVDLSPVRPNSGRCPAHVVVARIQYPPPRDGNSPRASDGYFVYIKPSFTGDESAHLVLYRDDRKQFPHDSTIDQFFEPERFDAYRQLGEHIGEAVWRELWKRRDDGAPVPAESDPTKDLWTWAPLQETLEKGEPAPDRDGIPRALRKLQSSTAFEREEAIAWLSDHVPGTGQESEDLVLEALKRAYENEADPHNRLMIDKAIYLIGGTRKSVRKFFKERMRRG
jgi:hypothetical protein